MKRLLGLAALGLSATPALAHHPMGGTEMTGFADGLLSGIGHPILGFDHLFFVALAGTAAALAGQAFAAPLAYIAAMIAGVLIATFGPGLPVAEAMIAVSLLALGGVVLSGRRVSAPATMAIFAGFGLFHGSAFGGAMATAEAGAAAAVLPGYLLGLAAVQYAIALGAGLLTHRIATGPNAIQPRLAGAMVAGIGLFLTLEAVESGAVAALGWG